MTCWRHIETYSAEQYLSPSLITRNLLTLENTGSPKLPWVICVELQLDVPAGSDHSTRKTLSFRMYQFQA